MAPLADKVRDSARCILRKEHHKIKARPASIIMPPTCLRQRATYTQSKKRPPHGSKDAQVACRMSPA
jgi:hypothetical protein